MRGRAGAGALRPPCRLESSAPPRNTAQAPAARLTVRLHTLLQEVYDPTAVRALRFVRHDPLTAPDEPLRVRWRFFHAPPSARRADDCDEQQVVIVPRELCTVGEVHAAIAAQAGVGLDASRLVLRGCALVDPDQVLFDAGYKSPAAVVYLQLRKTGGASADGGGWDFGGHAP